MLLRFKPMWLLLPLITLPLLASSEEAEDDNSDVFVMTPDNIDSFLADNDIAVLEFYAPWCGHCKQFAPEYEKIATHFKETHNIAVAKTDCDEHSAIGQRFDVSGYPTIKIWKSGEAYDYKGGRSLEAIEEKVLEMNGDSWEPPKPATVDLTSENFDEITKGDFALVMFYAPWCGHCKKMKPDFEEAAQHFIDNPVQDVNQQPVIAKLDATVEGTIASQFDVSGYPTLKIFRQGSVSEYKGGRSAREMIEEISKYMKPASRPFKTANEAKRRVIETRGNSVLVFCINDDDAEEKSKTDEIANNFRNDWLDVHHIDTEEIRSAINCQPGDYFIVHDESFRSKYEDERVKIASVEDVDNNRAPLVGQGKKESFAGVYHNNDKSMVKVFAHIDFSPKYRKASQIIRKKVLPVADKFRDMYFVLMDEDEMKDGVKQCGLDDSAEDINICISTGPNGKMVYPLEIDDDFSEKVLLKFVQDVRDGKIEHRIKTAKAPKKNNGPVKIVVATEFDKILFEEGKDVLVEFYAPWCGHCKSLEPIYKKLGKFYESEKDLVIAKMDLIANEIPNDKIPPVEGFPTLYYVDKENKVEKYESGRDLKSFKKFLSEKRGPGKDEL